MDIGCESPIQCPDVSTRLYAYAHSVVASWQQKLSKKITWKIKLSYCAFHVL